MAIVYRGISNMLSNNFEYLFEKQLLSNYIIEEIDNYIIIGHLTIDRERNKYILHDHEVPLKRAQEYLRLLDHFGNPDRALEYIKFLERNRTYIQYFDDNGILWLRKGNSIIITHTDNDIYRVPMRASTIEMYDDDERVVTFGWRRIGKFVLLYNNHNKFLQFTINPIVYNNMPGPWRVTINDDRIIYDWYDLVHVLKLDRVSSSQLYSREYSILLAPHYTSEAWKAEEWSIMMEQLHELGLDYLTDFHYYGGDIIIGVKKLNNGYTPYTEIRRLTLETPALLDRFGRKIYVFDELELETPLHVQIIGSIF